MRSKSKLNMIILIFILALLPSYSVYSDNTAVTQTEVKVSDGKAAGAVAVRNDYIYIAVEGGLSIVNAKDADNLRQVSYLALPEAVDLIELRGSYAYLLAGQCLYTVDISRPAEPVLVNVTSTGAGESMKGAVSDSRYLYSVDGSRIMVFSLEEPARPILQSAFLMDDSRGMIGAYDIAVRDGTAYIAMGYGGILICDVSDVSVIGFLGICPVGDGFCSSIDVFGNLAFVRKSDTGSMEILEITTRRNPVHAGTIGDTEPDGAFSGIGMYEDYVFIPDASGGVVVKDISSLSGIKQSGHIDITEKAISVLVEGEKVYITDSLGYINITDISRIGLKKKERKLAYITIDDGPSRNNTVKILDTLKEYGVHATFFVLPRDKMDDIYRRIIDEGHVIGNHSYSHDYVYLYDSADGFRKDVARARDFIYRKLKYTSRVFRFPGGTMGKSKEKVKERADILKELGYTYFDWDVSTADTDPNLHKYGDEERIAEILANNVVNNTKDRKKLVILMHDSSDKIYTVKALPKIIEGLKAKGYKFDVLTKY